MIFLYIQIAATFKNKKMETYEEKIKNSKIKTKLISIRVSDPELLAFFNNLKRRRVGISKLTRELWKDSPDYSAWKNSPDYSAGKTAAGLTNDIS